MTEAPATAPVIVVPSRPSVARQAAAASVLGAGIAALATWYGELESAGGHPSLKLGGAMALAGAGVAALLVAKPADHMPEPAHRHSALVSLHPLRLGVALVSVAAALIHFAVIKQHFEEYWIYGGFFIMAATAQLVWAVLAVVRPFRLMLVAGVLGNAFILITWVVTRTYGLLVGPDATEPASAGFGDILSTVFEASIVVAALVLLRMRGWAEASEQSNGGQVLNGLAAIGITLLTVLGLYSAVAGMPFVTHVG